MGAIYSHGGHLDIRTTTICTYFQSPFNTRRHIKFEEIWPRGSEKSFKGVNGRTDRRIKDDGRRVITIAHPELKKKTKKKNPDEMSSDIWHRKSEICVTSLMLRHNLCCLGGCCVL